MSDDHEDSDDSKELAAAGDFNLLVDDIHALTDGNYSRNSIASGLEAALGRQQVYQAVGAAREWYSPYGCGIRTQGPRARCVFFQRRRKVISRRSYQYKGVGHGF